MLNLLKISSVFLCAFTVVESCYQRTYNSDSFVCVCNSTACDFLGTITPPDAGFFNVLTSTKDELRFSLQTLPMGGPSDNATLRIFVNASDFRQQMTGFGGAFTDSTGYNIGTLTSDLQDMIIRQYFSTEGIEYNVARIPIAGTDFSLRQYSYDDNGGVPDPDLTKFNLEPEDYYYKLPFIKRAMEVSGRQMRFFGSPWSPPVWMKTYGEYNGTGVLQPEMQQPWANYFVKFIDSYKAEGVPMWGLTAQNEPLWGYWNQYSPTGCGYTPETQRDFVKGYLGPTLVSAGYDEVILMITDDNRNSYPDYPATVLSDPEAYLYVDGIATHWYEDKTTSSSVMVDMHNLFPEKFIMYTEACGGWDAPSDERVLLGSWNRLELYVEDILENVLHWSTGWVDWNMALDMQGGPSFVFNYVDSPIIINSAANEFYRQPMFYAMGHFSKFIPEGSFALGTSFLAPSKESTSDQPQFVDGIRAAAFVDPSNNIVIVAINRFDYDQVVIIEDTAGNAMTLTLPSRSVHTITYAQ